MPRLTPASQTERRQRIADAAFDLFVKQGIGPTTMVDISQLSGLSAGSIYSHFSSKTQIVEYVAVENLGRRWEEVRATLAEEGASPSPREAVRIILAPEAFARRAMCLMLDVLIESRSQPEYAGVASRAMQSLRDVVGSVLLPWVATRFGAAGTEAHRLARAHADLTLAVIHGFAARAHADQDSLEELYDNLLTAMPE